MKPGQCIDDVAKKTFSELLGIMESREASICNNHDAKSLHDFRVALRRTRTLLRCLKGVLPKATIRRFKREFEWIGDVTGSARDLDVYFDSLDELGAYLPKKRQVDLLPFRDYLNELHKKEQLKVSKLLGSKRYRCVMKDWNKIVTKPVTKKTRLLHAKDPVLVVANKSIWHGFSKVKKMRSAINSVSSANSLHELRKTCKHLRYLMEFFLEIYPKKKSVILLDKLKLLQNNLGEFQDLAVQRHLLNDYNSSISRHSEKGKKAADSMDMLSKKMDTRQKKIKDKCYRRFNHFNSKKIYVLYKKLLVSSGI